MGCCGSSEAVAPETELPPPEWGKPIKVTMKKKGVFSADYNIYTEGSETPWMLLDAVGSMWDSGYSYYLKHRSAGQVDAEGKPTSTVLGAVNIKGDWDAFSFRVSGGNRDVDIGPHFDFWDGDVDWGLTSSKKLWAVWTFSKRALLFKDHEQKEQIGWLDITGSGTWFEEEIQRVVHDTDADGRTTTRYETERHTDCKTRGFRYKFNVFNTPMLIKYSKSGGSFWSSPTLNFHAANAFAPDIPLFTVSGNGESNCTINTFEHSDPVSSLLAAYAISCKLDPKEFGDKAQGKCECHMRLGMPPGHSEMIGMDEAQFEATFTKYPAPVPAVFAAQVAAFVPVTPVPMMVAAMPVQQPMMVQQQPMMMQQQPGMVQQQPMMQPQPGMQQPMMMQQPGMQQPMMMQQQPGMVQQQPMMMQQQQPGMVMAQPMS